MVMISKSLTNCPLWHPRTPLWCSAASGGVSPRATHGDRLRPGQGEDWQETAGNPRTSRRSRPRGERREVECSTPRSGTRHPPRDGGLATAAGEDVMWHLNACLAYSGQTRGPQRTGRHRGYERDEQPVRSRSTQPPCRPGSKRGAVRNCPHSCVSPFSCRLSTCDVSGYRWSRCIPNPGSTGS
jgi:hypothetical protein